MSEADKIIKSLRDSGKKVEEFYMSNKTSDKNVANIEDDIKLVKRYLENSAYKETDSDFFKNGGWEMVDLEIPKAMANILAEREQKDKRIQELEEQVKTLDEAYTGVIKESKKWFDIAHNSIPKQVVIDKMGELNKEIKSCDEIDAIFKIKQQQILQELLEGEKNEF